jgi:hypothetical protein
MKRRNVKATFRRLHGCLDAIEKEIPAAEDGSVDGWKIAEAFIAFAVGIGVAEFEEPKLREIIDRAIATGSRYVQDQAETNN